MINQEFSIKLMRFYKKIGKIIYLIIFSALIIETILQGLGRKHGFIIFIFAVSIFALIGLLLESVLINYSQLGTIYTETDKNITTSIIKQIEINNINCYILETEEDYSFEIMDEAYKKTYRKDAVNLEESSSIETPIVEITRIERTSQKANNDYSIFATVGEKNKTLSVKIIVKNKTKDIINNYIDL